MPLFFEFGMFVNGCYQPLPRVPGCSNSSAPLSFNHFISGSSSQLALLPGVRLQEGDLRHVWAQNHRH